MNKKAFQRVILNAFIRLMGPPRIITTRPQWLDHQTQVKVDRVVIKREITVKKGKVNKKTPIWEQYGFKTEAEFRKKYPHAGDPKKRKKRKGRGIN